MQPLLSEIKDIEIIPVSNVKEVLDQALKKELMSEQILTTLDLSKKKVYKGYAPAKNRTGAF